MQLLLKLMSRLAEHLCVKIIGGYINKDYPPVGYRAVVTYFGGADAAGSVKKYCERVVDSHDLLLFASEECFVCHYNLNPFYVPRKENCLLNL